MLQFGSFYVGPHFVVFELALELHGGRWVYVASCSADPRVRAAYLGTAA